MPRTPSSLPARPSKDLNASRRPEPKLKRSINQQVPDLINARREAGQPYRYTTKDVRAILRYVNDKPTAERPSFFTTSDQAKVDDIRRTSRNFGERIAAERKKTLADRIEKPRLVDRISNGTAAAPIQPSRRPLIDFAKLSHDDLIASFIPRIKAVIKRLAPVIKLDRFQLLPNDIKDPVERLVHGLDKFYNHIRTTNVTHEEWRSLHFGLHEISEISFKGLRPNHTRIALAIARVYNGNYFNVLDKVV